jgi:methionyl-tRNA synthetase
MTERFYVSTPIYYVNDKPHIGHAYCTVLADAARRWQALLGAETYFVTGTDEHGQKVEQAAAKRGLEPQAHCDELHQKFKDLWPELHCAPNQFIRTTEPRHVAVVQRALAQLHAQGLIEARDFEGWYCTADERFWTEKELKDGSCPDCGRQVSKLTERNWFFLMSRFQQPLIDAIRSGRMQIVPANRANEVLGFLAQPLQDLCISRPRERLKWGIPLPFDDRFVCYVWFDALLNYVTAVGGLGADTDAPGGFDAWWPHITHFLGKDILTTHAVYWPTMLLALGLPLPKRLVTTGWWLQGDAKMSKSLGNVVSPLDMKDRYGAEVLRYFLLREMSVGQDANFTEEALLRRNNADLANDLGNLVQRSSALCHKHFAGQVPEPSAHPPVRASLAIAKALLGQGVAEGVEPVAESVRAFRFHRTIADVMLLVQALNTLMTAEAPFKTVQSDRAAAADALYQVLDGLRLAANLLEPVLPQTAREILRRVGWTGGLLPIAQLAPGQLQPGAALGEGPPLFPKHVLPTPEPVAAVAPTASVAATSQPSPPQTELANIDFEAFAAVQLRVGTVRVAEAVPKSQKLLRLLIDLGEPQPRQILAGIAETVAPADLLGRQVLVVANLAPRKLMGHESHGMLLVAEDAEGKRVPMHPARAVANGAQVK